MAIRICTQTDACGLVLAPSIQSLEPGTADASRKTSSLGYICALFLHVPALFMIRECYFPTSDSFAYPVAFSLA